MAQSRLLQRDMEFEILCRLPVKSLLRFKSVCKQWFDLIQSPEFMRMHFCLHKNSSFLILQETPGHAQQVLDYVPENDTSDLLNHVFHGHAYLRRVSAFASICGPINGFFLLVCHEYRPNVNNRRHRMAMWNPSTRVLNFLLDFQTEHTPSGGYHRLFGFGFDPSANNYVVVWLRYLLIPVPGGADLGFQIQNGIDVGLFTVGRDDSWRLLNLDLPPSCDIPKHYSCCCSNIYVDGAYYWLSKNNHKLLVFDWRRNNITEINTPVTSSTTMMVKLSAHDDSVAFFLFYKGTNESVQMWIMKQRGCWVKHLTIPPFIKVSYPLEVFNNEEVSVAEHLSTILIRYNDKHPNYHNTAVKIWGYGFDQFSFFNYKESLFSLEGGIVCSDKRFKEFSTFKGFNRNLLTSAPSMTRKRKLR